MGRKHRKTNYWSKVEWRVRKSNVIKLHYMNFSFIFFHLTFIRMSSMLMQQKIEYIPRYSIYLTFLLYIFSTKYYRLWFMLQSGLYYKKLFWASKSAVFNRSALGSYPIILISYQSRKCAFQSGINQAWNIITEVSSHHLWETIGLRW